MEENLNKDLFKLKAKWRDKAALVIFASQDSMIELSKIAVDEKSRNEGVGSAIMRDIVEIASRYEKTLVLTPSSAYGGSRTRLVKFYKRFGFVENKGKNKMFETMQAMIRKPS